MKYNIEKILYLADKPKGFKVSIDESTKRGNGFSETDIEYNIRFLLSIDNLKLFNVDDHGKYYQTTLKGKICLTSLQISERKRLGKCIKSKLKTLNELKEL